MKNIRKNRKGQAIVEYIIIVAIVAIAALAVIGIFSDRVRTIISGVSGELGCKKQSDISRNSERILKDMEADGIDVLCD